MIIGTKDNLEIDQPTLTLKLGFKSILPRVD